MTSNPLWFVLAGFLLGFATSTLWEWFHFRKARLRMLESRTRDVDGGVRSRTDESAGVPSRRVAAEREWTGQAYRSPGIFLESESPEPERIAARRPAAEPSWPVDVHDDQDAPVPPPTVAEVASARVGSLPPRRRQEVLAALRRTTPPPAKPETPTAAKVGADDDEGPPFDDAPLAPPDPGRAWRDDMSLTQPSTDHPDDLSKITGIGDVYRQRLFRAGYYTWRQIAEADLPTLRQATGAYPSSNVEEWPPQARALMLKHKREQASYVGPPPDELTKILGIGKVSAQTLYRAGICTYEQLASASVPALAALFPIAVAGDQPDFAAWIVQAARLADQKHGS